MHAQKRLYRGQRSSNIDQIEIYLENKIRGETCRLGALVVVKPEHNALYLWHRAKEIKDSI